MNFVYKALKDREERDSKVDQVLLKSSGLGLTNLKELGSSSTPEVSHRSPPTTTLGVSMRPRLARERKETKGPFPRSSIKLPY